MVAFFNASGTLGHILTSSVNMTGDIIVSLLILIIILLAIAIMFNIPIEFTVVVVLPLLMAYMSYYGQFVAVGIVTIIYLAFILLKRFIFK